VTLKRLKIKAFAVQLSNKLPFSVD